MYENDIHYLVFVFFWYGYLEVSNNIFFRSWKYFKEFMQFFNKRDYLRYYLIVKVQRNFIPTEILFREQCPTCWPPFNFNKYVNTLFLLLFCLCSHCPIFLKLQFFPPSICWALTVWKNHVFDDDAILIIFGKMCYNVEKESVSMSLLFVLLWKCFLFTWIITLQKYNGNWIQ